MARIELALTSPNGDPARAALLTQVITLLEHQGCIYDSVLARQALAANSAADS